MAHEEHDDGKIEQAADERQERLADPERDHQVEDDDPQVEERLEEPAVEYVPHARRGPARAALEGLEGRDARRRHQEPAGVVAERYPEVDAARGVVIDAAEEPALAAH